IFAKLGATAVEQRTDDVAAARVDGGQPAGAGAAQQTQQKRLGLIVARMAGGDEFGAELEPRALEERMARVSRGVFDRSSFARRFATDVLAPGDEWPAELFGQRPAEGFVGVRPIAKLMVEVRDARDLQIARDVIPGELAQQVRERHGLAVPRTRVVVAL